MPSASNVSKNGRPHSTLQDGEATPQWLFDHLNQRVTALSGQPFQLDAAASEWNAKCADYFDEQVNALAQDWSKWPTIFCNPPFQSPIISNFVAKAIATAEKGPTVVLILPVWQGYPWFQEVKRRGQMCDIIGPVVFNKLDGSQIVLNNGYKTSAIPGRGHFWGLRPNPSGCFVKLQPEQMSLI